MTGTVRPMSASIRIDGLVEEPTAVDAARLAGLPSVIAEAAGVVRGAVGTAVRVEEVLQLTRPASSATHCTVIAGEDGYRASIPLDELVAGGWLAFGLEGGSLPRERGGPFRLTVARGATLCWNVKDVVALHLASEREDDDVPAAPPH